MAGTARQPERDRHAAELASALAALYAALRVDVLDRVAAGFTKGAQLVVPMWGKRASDIARGAMLAVAYDVGVQVAAELSKDPSFDPAVMDAYLKVGAETFGTQWINDAREAAQAAASGDDAAERVAELFDTKVEQAPPEAAGVINRAANFASIEAAKAEGMATKTWRTGAKARASHVALNGETQPIGDTFSNGLKYPGAPGPPQEVINCNCTMTFGRSSD